MAADKFLLNDGASRILLNDGASFLLLNTISADAVVADSTAERRGGAGHKVRVDRYWKGKYAGTFSDQEWTEYLLAALSADVAEAPPPPVRNKQSRKIRRQIVEPEAYAETSRAESIDALQELRVETLLVLIEQAQSAIIENLIQAALFKKRRQEEEDDIAFLLMAS